jgi:hypothetical protein
MALYGLSALLGLTAAGYDLLNARGTVTRSIPAEDLAVVNQQPILRSDFINQVEAETGTTYDKASRQDRLRVLDEMIDEELKVQRGLELNFPETDQDSRNALANVVDHQTTADVASSQPSDADLRTFYASHRAEYHSPGILTVCDLRASLPNLPASAQSDRARQAFAALAKGVPAGALPKQYGYTLTNGCENNFYFAIKLHLGERLFAIAERMTTGAISDPIFMEDGTHLLKVLANMPPIAESYEDVRGRVVDDFRSTRESQVRSGTMGFLRHRATILVAEDYADYQINGSHQ